jgi:S1-C subfamily serine protease
MPKYALPLAALLAISLLSGCVGFRPLVAEVEKDGRKQTLTGYADPGQVRQGTMQARSGGYVCEGEIVRTQGSGSPLSCEGQKGFARVRCRGDEPVQTTWTAVSCQTGYGGGINSRGMIFKFAYSWSEADAARYLAKVRAESVGNTPSRAQPPVGKHAPTAGVAQAPARESITGKAPGLQDVGTGFFVSNDGYLVTSDSVVRGKQTLAVVMRDGTKLEATYVRGDRQNDLAVLKVKASTKALRFLGNVEKGEEVFVLGYATTSARAVDQHVRLGYVSATSRLDGDARFVYVDLASLQAGSGAPILNRRGQVVAIVSNAATGELAESCARCNLGFKAEYAEPLLRSFIADSRAAAAPAVTQNLVALIKSIESSIALVLAK